MVFYVSLLKSFPFIGALKLSTVFCIRALNPLRLAKDSISCVPGDGKVHRAMGTSVSRKEDIKEEIRVGVMEPVEIEPNGLHPSVVSCFFVL